MGHSSASYQEVLLWVIAAPLTRRCCCGSALIEKPKPVCVDRPTCGVAETSVYTQTHDVETVFWCILTLAGTRHFAILNHGTGGDPLTFGS